MERTNDHERAIAKTVDEKLVEYPGNHRYTIIGEVAESLDFVMSASDSQFLVSYVQLRRTHRSVPQIQSNLCAPNDCVVGAHDGQG